MAAQHRQQPSRLFIPPMLNAQLANSVDTRSMFSPALQTAHQPGFPPLPSAHPFNSGFPLQTPVQPSFFHGHHPAPGAPPRQMGHGHRPNGSIAHIPSVGIQPQIPMTPFGSQFPPQMLHGGGPPNVPGQPFVPKSRRTPSMIGGPPKAALGGPNRKVSPLPPSSQVAAIAEKVKAKKIPVKIPIESECDGEDADASKKSLWSRQPIPISDVQTPPDPEPPEVSSGESYPDEEYRKHLPPTVDVFLPSREAWNEMKQREIDEKLEKLGIERRSESDHAEVLSMRARAASISSPADPALLMFKLNKLQKQQSAGNSLATSPQPHSTTSVSPNPLLRSQTHGHSMSLAQPPLLPLSAPNGFSSTYAQMKPDSPTGGNQSSQPASPLGIYAPQGRVPAQLFVPSAPSQTESRPDFARGFGLDIPEEEEEELEPQESGTGHAADRTITDAPKLHEDNVPLSELMQAGNVEQNVTAPKEGTHTRHTSRISVALSIGSTSKNLDEAMIDHTRQSSTVVPNQGLELKSESTADALNEWTGSESDELSDDQESIGEWSNPSDEERARQERLQRRYMRRMHREAEGAPRRLPEFPKPPENRYAVRNDDEDIISNPSDEGRRMSFNDHAMNGLYYPQPQMDPNGRASRPLPPVPHSRDPSNQYSYYGSLPSQSPDHFTTGQISVPNSRPESMHHTKTPSLSGTKKELNPFAKPFVFVGRSGLTPAVPPSAPVSEQSETAASPIQATQPTHSRASSFGASKKLNAAAQEFKPGTFTFRLPDDVPRLSFSEPTHETSRPLPEPPVIGITTAVQGREKRRRTSLSSGSDSSHSDLDNGQDSMASFRFPLVPEHTTAFAHSAPTSPSQAANRTETTLNTSTKLGTFSGFSNRPPTLPPLLGQEQRSSPDGISESNFPSLNATRGSGLGDEQKSLEMTLPNIQKQKRAPIPLDFKHPVSTNMVPAGLFKNLGTGDPDSALNGRSHNGGLDFSESKSEISLDDLSVPRISRRRTKRVPKPEDLDDTEDEFNGASDASNDGTSEPQDTRPNSPPSQKSKGAPDVTSYSQGLRLEDRLESLIDHKIDMLRNDLSVQLRGSGFISSSTDELVREAMAMFRTQLRDSAAKGLNDSSVDAHGELDFEVIKGIIEQGQEDLRKSIQEDLATILQNIRDTEGTAAPESILELMRNVQELRANVLASNSHVTGRLDAIGTGMPYKSAQPDREALVLDIISALRPQLAAIRSEPIDYEVLTLQLSQAVKPHISQLIDLASDKRETAGLIVEQLMPVLQSLASGTREFDASNLVSEISATVNRIIAPIDAHSIKEQVADLVVERLDSRLATQNNDVSINFDKLKSKVTESISPLLEQISGLDSSIRAISSEQSALTSVTCESSSKQVDVLRDLTALAEKLGGLTDTLKNVQSLIARQNEASDIRAQQLDRIESSLGTAGTSGAGLSAEEKETILSFSREVLARFTPISDTIISALASHETRQAELLSRLKSMDDSTQEVRRLITQNAELQVQLNKARSQHGQIRVQHDNLVSKVTSVEEERDQLRAKVEEMNVTALAHVAEFAALEARNSEQERAMHAALDRLKISDVNAQSFQERIAELEKANREVTQENQQLKLRINRLEMQAEFAAQDKESTLHALKLLQEDRDRLAAEQSHWEEFRQTEEQIEKLTNLVSQAESDEIAELKRIRDQSKVLEGEHAALKKRFKEQEGKIANIERASATARQNLAQAQQRSADWERKAREFEGEVERLTTALDQSEQTKNQLDADYSLAKLQLEEKEAEDRIVKDRERKLEEQIASLKTQISNLTSELEEERRSKASQWRRSRERPSSAEYHPSEPPTPRINGKPLPNANSSRASVVSPQPARTSSTWDSMHAPRVRQAAYLSRSQRSSVYGSRAPSPTPSTMSVVTQGEDGWYS